MNLHTLFANGALYKDLVGMKAAKTWPLKAALLSNPFLHTLQYPACVPCRIRLIEHGLNWINHILHAGAQGLLNRLEYEVAKHLGI